MALHNYALLELKINSLLKLNSATFTQSERKEVDELKGFGEYGLALQTFLGVVLEEGKSISAETLSIVEELITLMDMSDEIDLERFRHLIHPD